MKNLDAASATRADQQGRTVAQRFTEERALLRPLPERPFEARQVVPVGVSENLVAGEVAIDSPASSCCGTPFAATPNSAFSALNLYPPVVM